MNPSQAQQIRERYHALPQQRAEQEQLIRVVYAGQLRGKPFFECSDAQIYSVTRRLYLEALRYHANSLEQAIHNNIEQFQRQQSKRKDVEALVERIALQMDSLPADHRFIAYFDELLKEGKN